MSSLHKTYRVSVETSSTEEFVVEAPSPEAAEAIAEQLIEEGETGETTSFEILASDATPAEMIDGELVDNFHRPDVDDLDDLASQEDLN